MVEQRELSDERVSVRRDAAGRAAHAVVSEQFELGVAVAARIAAEHLVVSPVLAHDVEHVLDLRARVPGRRRGSGSPAVAAPDCSAAPARSPRRYRRRPAVGRDRERTDTPDQHVEHVRPVRALRGLERCLRSAEEVRRVRPGAETLAGDPHEPALGCCLDIVRIRRCRQTADQPVRREVRDVTDLTATGLGSERRRRRAPSPGESGGRSAPSARRPRTPAPAPASGRRSFGPSGGADSDVGGRRAAGDTWACGVGELLVLDVVRRDRRDRRGQVHAVLRQHLRPGRFDSEIAATASSPESAAYSVESSGEIASLIGAVPSPCGRATEMSLSPSVRLCRRPRRGLGSSLRRTIWPTRVGDHPLRMAAEIPEAAAKATDRRHHLCADRIDHRQVAAVLVRDVGAALASNATLFGYEPTWTSRCVSVRRSMTTASSAALSATTR